MWDLSTNYLHSILLLYNNFEELQTNRVALHARTCVFDCDIAHLGKMNIGCPRRELALTAQFLNALLGTLNEHSRLRSASKTDRQFQRDLNIQIVAALLTIVDVGSNNPLQVAAARRPASCNDPFWTPPDSTLRRFPQSWGLISLIAHPLIT